MSKRILPVSLLVVLSALGMTLTPTLAQETPELPEECGVVSLEYWNPFTGPDGPFMGQMVDAFNAANPNIQVMMTTQSEHYTQLSTAAASNTLPQVAIIHADQIATHVYRNILRPIDAIVEEVGIVGDDFPTAVWEAGEVNESRYAIPLDIHPMTMFVNVDMLEAAGFSAAPTTAEEFEAIATALTGDGNYGFFITAGFPIRQIFETLLYQFGGSSFSEDATEAAWNSEAGVQAAQWLLDAQAAYSEANLEVDAELNAFKGGNIGIIWNGIWQTTNVTGDGVFFNAIATAMPQIGTQRAVWAGSHQLALPVQPEEDACRDTAAGLFIRYLLDNSVTWASAGQLPANNVVRASEEFAEIQPQADIAAGSAEYVFLPPSIPGIGDAYGPLDEAIGALMSGNATDIQAELDNAADRANQILEQNAELYGDAS